MILEKMKSFLWKLELGFWTFGFIRRFDARMKVTYNLLLIGFFHKLISMQDVRCNMLRLTFSSTASIILRLCTSELSPNNDKDAELNRQFLFGIDPNKILQDFPK